MSRINLYTEYLFKLRNLTLREPFIIIKDDINPMLKHYMKLVNNITFNHESYHTYYGDIKNIINSFTRHWTDVMDDAIKETDKYLHFIDKEDLVVLIAKTIDIEKEEQDTFTKSFANSDDPIEKEKFNEIQELYIDYLKKIDLLTEQVNKLDKQEKIEAFAEDLLPQSLQRKNEIFSFTYDFISLKLVLAVDRIRVSLEEILKRLRNNIKNIHEKLEGSVSELLLQLYEKNKENLILSRQDVRSSVEVAEVKRGMDILIDKIEDSKHFPVKRLYEECDYWEKLVEEFRHIEKTLKKLEEEEKNLVEQEKMESDDSKEIQDDVNKSCWTLEQKLEHVRGLKLKAAKVLFTFFSVRGEDYIYYKDKTGMYHVDEYGHQVYTFDYGLNVLHVNCQGNFINHSEGDAHYYDENGRYIIENGQKTYQIAACTSKYKIEDDVLIKQTRDCGHSDMENTECRLQIKDPNDVVLLPDATPKDIKGSLDSEDIKYLWDTFGHILPELLYDVAETKSKNPIHCLAHKLLQYKCKEFRDEEKEEATLYRQKIYQDRLEKVNSMYNKCRAKQAHVKQEEDDDSGLRAHREREELVMGLNYYN